MTLKQGDTGALLKCHAGCSPEAITNALGLTMADLFDAPRAQERRASTGKRRERQRGSTPSSKVHRLPDREQKTTAAYLYESASGDALRRKVRLEPGYRGRSKSFVWEKPGAGETWERCSEDGNPHVLYALPLVAEAEVVHLNEGEKGADRLNAYFAEHGMGDHAATCAPSTAWEPIFTDTLKSKTVVMWVDCDEPGEAQARSVYAELCKAGTQVEAVQARSAAEKADAFDHLEAGYAPDQGEPFHIELDEEQRDALEMLNRFSETRTSISYIFDTDPPPRTFLVADFLPARESGLIIARGGTGKGFAQIRLALSIALGEPFGPFNVDQARGVVLVSSEDDRDEFHRRMRDALRARGGDDQNGRGWSEYVRDALVKRIRFVDLRGVTRHHLGHDLRGAIACTAERIADVDTGLVLVDPLGRFSPPGLQINSQEGAAVLVTELDAMREVTNAAVIAVYHVTKNAVKEGGELRSGASSGSLQLEDLSRWVLNLKSLTRKEANDYGLDHTGNYVEAAVTKTNYTPPLSEPLVFQRVAGGALVHVAAKSRNQIDDQAVLATLLKAGDWLYREEWDEQAKETHDIGKERSKSARERLKRAGKVVIHEVREGRRSKVFFAPAERLRPMGWPAPPTTLPDTK